jgi:hypothetical protein
MLADAICWLFVIGGLSVLAWDRYKSKGEW